MVSNTFRGVVTIPRLIGLLVRHADRANGARGTDNRPTIGQPIRGKTFTTVVSYKGAVTMVIHRSRAIDIDARHSCVVRRHVRWSVGAAVGAGTRQQSQLVFQQFCNVGWQSDPLYSKFIMNFITSPFYTYIKGRYLQRSPITPVLIVKCVTTRHNFSHSCFRPCFSVIRSGTARFTLARSVWSVFNATSTQLVSSFSVLDHFIDNSYTCLVYIDYRMRLVYNVSIGISRESNEMRLQLHPTDSPMDHEVHLPVDTVIQSSVNYAAILAFRIHD